MELTAWRRTARRREESEGEMMTTKYPTWGVLVKAPLTRVCELLADFTDLELRTDGEWTAAYYMVPGDTSDDAAAEVLRLAGLVPVYRFDFSRYEYLTMRWDGEQWHPDEEPAVVLMRLNTKFGIPGSNPPTPPTKPAVVRGAIVVDGVSVDEARAMVPEYSFDIRPGPHGAIVNEPPGDSFILFWERAPRVLELLFYAATGNFRFRIMKGEECLGTFKPGATRTWDGTPFLADFEGETTPEGIVAKLGIEPGFLAREPVDGPWN